MEKHYPNTLCGLIGWVTEHGLKPDEVVIINNKKTIVIRFDDNATADDVLTLIWQLREYKGYTYYIDDEIADKG